MKNVLRIFSLVTFVSLAWLSTAHAGTCVITCSDGTKHTFSAGSSSACCSQMDSICPNGARGGTYNGQQCPL